MNEFHLFLDKAEVILNVVCRINKEQLYYRCFLFSHEFLTEVWKGMLENSKLEDREGNIMIIAS